MSNSVEATMFKAVSDCHLAEVSFLMLHHPDLNVNWIDVTYQETFLKRRR